MSELLQYRFPGSLEDGAADDGGGLAGHAVGNLLIAAMTAVEGGDFEEGVRLMNRVLAVRGQVVPVVGDAAHAPRRAGRRDGRRRPVADHAHRRHRPGLGHPDDVRPSEDALAAIADAELIVLGPGSLYTSLLPSLLIPAIRDAVAGVAGAARLRLQRRDAGRARRPASTSPTTSRRSSRTRRRASVDVVLANNRFDARAPTELAAPRPSGCAGRRPSSPVPRLVLDDVVDPENAHHHDPARLAAALIARARARERQPPALERRAERPERPAARRDPATRA